MLHKHKYHFEDAGAGKASGIKAIFIYYFPLFMGWVAATVNSE